MTLELDDAEKPITVANFLNYLNSGRYENVFAHRLDPGFVLQSGGFNLSDNSLQAVSTDPPIANEFTNDPRFSNLYGTIAMAKVGNDPNSATSQWFINLANNVFLDSTNGGFTVFGRVIDGFNTLEKFNTDFPKFPADGRGVYDVRPRDGNGTPDPSSPFGELPLLDDELITENFLFSDLAVIPEPATLALLALAGTAGILRRITRKRRVKYPLNLRVNSRRFAGKNHLTSPHRFSSPTDSSAARSSPGCP